MKIIDKLNISFKKFNNNVPANLPKESDSDDRTIKILDNETGECKMIFEGHELSVLSIDKTDTNELISCSCDETIKVWNLSTGSCKFTIQCYETIKCVRYLENDLFAVGYGKMLRFYSLKNEELIAFYGGHEDTIERIEFIKSKNKLMTMSIDGIIKIWSYNPTVCLLTIPFKPFHGQSDVFIDRGIKQVMRELKVADAKLAAWIVNEQLTTSPDINLVKTQNISNRTSLLRGL